jgi:peptidoglycan/xylan/chitin deacetylase (PgdA/CDA1 family)
MNTVNPPPGSLARKNLEEVGREMIIATAYMRKQIEDRAKLLVNLRYPGKKFNELNTSQQQKLRIQAANMLNRETSGGKRRTRRYKSNLRRRTTQKRK